MPTTSSSLKYLDKVCVTVTLPKVVHYFGTVVALRPHLDLLTDYNNTNPSNISSNKRSDDKKASDQTLIINQHRSQKSSQTDEEEMLSYSYVFVKVTLTIIGDPSNTTFTGVDGWVPASWCTKMENFLTTTISATLKRLKQKERRMSREPGFDDDTSDQKSEETEESTRDEKAETEDSNKEQQQQQTQAASSKQQQNILAKENDEFYAAQSAAYPASLVYLGFEISNLLPTAWSAVLPTPPPSPSSNLVYSVHFCHKCLTPFTSKTSLSTHFITCHHTGLPSSAMEIFSSPSGNAAVYRIDGNTEPEFCLRVAILGRSFISSKDLWDTDVRELEFFLLYGTPQRLGLSELARKSVNASPYSPNQHQQNNNVPFFEGGFDPSWNLTASTRQNWLSLSSSSFTSSGHRDAARSTLYFAGFFSRVKRQPMHTLCCIMLLPCFQGRGLGSLLVKLAYSLDQVRITQCGCDERCGTKPGKVTEPWSEGGTKVLCSLMKEKLGLGGKRLLKEQREREERKEKRAMKKHQEDMMMMQNQHHQQQNQQHPTAIQPFTSSSFLITPTNNNLFSPTQQQTPAMLKNRSTSKITFFDFSSSSSSSSTATSKEKKNRGVSSDLFSNFFDDDDQQNNSELPKRRKREEERSQNEEDNHSNNNKSSSSSSRNSSSSNIISSGFSSSPLADHWATKHPMTWENLAKKLLPGMHPIDALKLLIADGLIAKVMVNEVSSIGTATTTTMKKRSSSSITGGCDLNDDDDLNNEEQQQQAITKIVEKRMGVVIIPKEVIAKQEMMIEQQKSFKLPSLFSSSGSGDQFSSSTKNKKNTSSSSDSHKQKRQQHEKMSSVEEFLREEYAALGDTLLSFDHYTADLFH